MYTLSAIIHSNIVILGQIITDSSFKTLALMPFAKDQTQANSFVTL